VWHKLSKSYVRIIDWNSKNDTYECAKMVYNDEEVEIEISSVPSLDLTKSVKINMISIKRKPHVE
jgi:hypothetical protein